VSNLRTSQAPDLIAAGASAWAQDAVIASERAHIGRLRFKGPDAHADLVAVSLYLLKRMALSPRSSQRTDALLARGCVLLEFFGVSNPVPMFSVDVGSPDHQRLSAAVLANVASPMYLAALRALAWREPDKVAARQRYFDTIGLRLRDELDWPSQEEFRAHAADASSRYEDVLRRLRESMARVHERRHSRLATLAAAAAPGLTSWTELLEDVAAEALAPRGGVDLEERQVAQGAH
jgi:hypothetical protein